MICLRREDVTINHLFRITEDEWRAKAHAAGYRAEALAKICGVSLRTLERYFHEVMGKCPHLWLNQERMRKARDLLIGATSVKETAAELGYKHAQHFSRNFKKHFGYSPEQAVSPLTIRPSKRR